MLKNSTLYAFIIGGFLHSILFFYSAEANENFTIAARVNKDIITNYEIEQRKTYG